MVEIFRTNVMNRKQAKQLAELIHHVYKDYHANFDLEDDDRILRVRSITGVVQSALIVDILKRSGFEAHVLPDNYPLPVLKLIVSGNLSQVLP